MCLQHVGSFFLLVNGTVGDLRKHRRRPLKVPEMGPDHDLWHILTHAGASQTKHGVWLSASYLKKRLQEFLFYTKSLVNKTWKSWTVKYTGLNKWLLDKPVWPPPWSIHKVAQQAKRVIKVWPETSFTCFCWEWCLFLLLDGSCRCG